MKWAIVTVRTLVGLVFFVFGLNGFLNFIPIPPPPTTQAGLYLAVLHDSHYLSVVKVFEIIGGAFLLSGRLAPMGLSLITPVAVNIALYELLLAHKPGLGVGLTVACSFLVWGYRGYFAQVFTANARVD